jgi:hypothetical protein
MNNRRVAHPLRRTLLYLTVSFNDMISGVIDNW